MKLELLLDERFKKQLTTVSERMRQWQEHSHLEHDELQKLKANLLQFNDTTSIDVDCTIGGVDAAGEYPLLSYVDSFVYLATAASVLYQPSASKFPQQRLQQRSGPEETVTLVWLPNSKVDSDRFLEEGFESMTGMSVLSVIEASDYRELKQRFGKRRNSSDPQTLYKNLIRPAATDTNSMEKLLKQSVEAAQALKTIQHGATHVLMDTTLTLPLIEGNASLFHEHLKRLCCKEARTRGAALLTLNKTPGFPGVELLEQLAIEQTGISTPEHWALRLPHLEVDGWVPMATQGRQVPPPGAISYLVRFHATAPIMRLDMDFQYWQEHIQGSNPMATRRNEQKLFEFLDFTTHDQHAFGYPFPLHDAQKEAALKPSEKAAYRKQVMQEALRAGMQPELFRDPRQDRI